MSKNIPKMVEKKSLQRFILLICLVK